MSRVGKMAKVNLGQRFLIRRVLFTNHVSKNLKPVATFIKKSVLKQILILKTLTHFKQRNLHRYIRGSY